MCQLRRNGLRLPCSVRGIYGVAQNYIWAGELRSKCQQNHKLRKADP